MSVIQKCLFTACLAFSAPVLAASSFGTVDGSVVNKLSGAPIKNAHVIYTRTSSSAGASSPVSTETDVEGHFNLQLAPGSYRLWVERNGFARQVYGALSPAGEGTALTLAPGQQIHEVVFRLVPLGAIAGRILDDDGEPLQGVGIQALRFSYANGRRQLVSVSGTSSNDRGEYRIFGLRAGRYLLRASMLGSPMSQPFESGALVPEVQDSYAAIYFPGTPDVDAASSISLAEGGELGDVDFRLHKIRAATVRGHLVSPSGKFSSSQIQVVLAHNDANFASFIDRVSAFVDPASGRFEVHGVSPGSYILVASQLFAGRSFGGRIPVEVSPAGSPEDVALPLAPALDITGSVEVEGAPRRALQNLSVHLSPSEGLTLGPEPLAKVGIDGTFRLAGVTPGRWTVALEPLPEGLWLKMESFANNDAIGGEVNVSEASRGQLRIVLAADGAQISGTVGKDGQPSQATVVLAPAAPELRGSHLLFRVTHTTEHGLFTMRNIKPGTYKLFAFQEIEPFDWLDPDLLKIVEASAASVTAGPGEAVQRDLIAIPPEALLPER
ncbi:MAG TPA: carboxypeptidase regulatory-like domain-containing protein [Candidatus Angelobacter sp.]|nr:carboxypeptidase regulatory-like domain-containing protein [Candidatus Angelobacter sp.]